MMSKSFDALCFFLLLIPSARIFTKAKGCCKWGDLQLGNTVTECIVAAEKERRDVTHIVLLERCDFFARDIDDPEGHIKKDVIISGTSSTALRFVHDDQKNFTFGRSLTFRGLSLNVHYSSKNQVAVEGYRNSSVDIFFTESEAVVSFTGCTFMPGLSMVFKTFVHVTVESSHFILDADKTPTMLEIDKGGVHFTGDGNQVKCIKGCNQPTIKVNICRDSAIMDVALYEDGLAPTFYFSPCEQAVENVPTLRIEGIRFNGQLATRDSALVIVRGDLVKGPTVIIADNDYDGLVDEAQGSVFRFIGTISLGEKSKFTVSRRFSRSIDPRFLPDMHLASWDCSFDEQAHRFPVLPIGKINVRAYDPCSTFCCYMETESGKKSFERSIGALTWKMPSIVFVTNDCCLGYNGMTFPNVTIKKGKSFIGETVSITLGEGSSYQFFGSTTIFENIRFKNARKAIPGAGDGVAAKMLLGRQGEPLNLKMSGCVVDTDVVIKLQNDVSFAATDTYFNQGNTESVLSLGAVNQVVELSKCVLADTVCHTMITGPLCGKVTIKNTELRKNSKESCTEAAVDLLICNTEEDVVDVPKLKIEGITFEGGISNVGNATWIKVEGSHDKGPQVTLLNNHYEGLNPTTQNGRVFRFIDMFGPTSAANSKFSVDVEGSSDISLPLKLQWLNKYLATWVCSNNGISYGYGNVLIIGDSGELTRGFCPSRCCYVVVETLLIYGGDIAVCLQIANKHDVGVIQVRKDCHFSTPASPISSVEIAKTDDISAGGTVKIYLDQNVYSFVNPMVFKNIRFMPNRFVAKIFLGHEVATGVNAAVEMNRFVAKIFLGHEVATGVNAAVEMIGCVVDENVIVKLLHNVHFTATDTTFNQGTNASVLYFAAAETSSATVVDCTFHNIHCLHEVITGYSCGNVEIKNTNLEIREKCSNAAINLSPCASNDDNKPATVKLEKLHFIGEIDDEKNAAWIKVQGNHNGPVVILKDNDYSNLTGRLHRTGRAHRKHSRVYQFWVFVSKVERHATAIRFSITREAQTGEQILDEFEADEELATVVYVESDGDHYFMEHIFPIGNGNLKERQIYVVSELCCYATKTYAHSSGYSENSSGYSIADCLTKGENGDQKTKVTVTKKCPLGDVTVVKNAVIQRDLFSVGPSLEITLNENQQYPLFDNVVLKHVTILKSLSIIASNARSLLSW